MSRIPKFIDGNLRYNFTGTITSITTNDDGTKTIEWGNVPPITDCTLSDLERHYYTIYVNDSYVGGGCGVVEGMNYYFNQGGLLPLGYETIEGYVATYLYDLFIYHDDYNCHGTLYGLTAAQMTELGLTSKVVGNTVNIKMYNADLVYMSTEIKQVQVPDTVVHDIHDRRIIIGGDEPTIVGNEGDIYIQYLGNVIDLSKITATAEDVAPGLIFIDADGYVIIGSRDA